MRRNIVVAPLVSPFTTFYSPHPGSLPQNSETVYTPSSNLFRFFTMVTPTFNILPSIRHDVLQHYQHLDQQDCPDGQCVDSHHQHQVEGKFQPKSHFGTSLCDNTLTTTPPSPQPVDHEKVDASPSSHLSSSTASSNTTSTKSTTIPHPDGGSTPSDEHPTPSTPTPTPTLSPHDQSKHSTQPSSPPTDDALAQPTTQSLFQQLISTYKEYSSHSFPIPPPMDVPGDGSQCIHHQGAPSSSTITPGDDTTTTTQQPFLALAFGKGNQTLANAYYLTSHRSGCTMVPPLSSLITSPSSNVISIASCARLCYNTSTSSSSSSRWNTTPLPRTVHPKPSISHIIANTIANTVNTNATTMTTTGPYFLTNPSIDRSCTHRHGDDNTPIHFSWRDLLAIAYHTNPANPSAPPTSLESFLVITSPKYLYDELCKYFQKQQEQQEQRQQQQQQQQRQQSLHHHHTATPSHIPAIPPMHHPPRLPSSTTASTTAPGTTSTTHTQSIPQPFISTNHVASDGTIPSSYHSHPTPHQDAPPGIMLPLPIVGIDTPGQRLHGGGSAYDSGEPLSLLNSQRHDTVRVLTDTSVGSQPDSVISIGTGLGLTSTGANGAHPNPNAASQSMPYAHHTPVYQAQQQPQHQVMGSVDTTTTTGAGGNFINTHLGIDTLSHASSSHSNPPSTHHQYLHHPDYQHRHQHQHQHQHQQGSLTTSQDHQYASRPRGSSSSSVLCCSLPTSPSSLADENYVKQFNLTFIDPSQPIPSSSSTSQAAPRSHTPSHADDTHSSTSVGREPSCRLDRDSVSNPRTLSHVRGSQHPQKDDQDGQDDEEERRDNVNTSSPSSPSSMYNNSVFPQKKQTHTHTTHHTRTESNPELSSNEAEQPAATSLITRGLSPTTETHLLHHHQSTTPSSSTAAAAAAAAMAMGTTTSPGTKASSIRSQRKSSTVSMPTHSSRSMLAGDGDYHGGDIDGNLASPVDDGGNDDSFGTYDGDAPVLSLTDSQRRGMSSTPPLQQQQQQQSSQPQPQHQQSQQQQQQPPPPTKPYIPLPAFQLNDTIYSITTLMSFYSYPYGTSIPFHPHTIDFVPQLSSISLFPSRKLILAHNAYLMGMGDDGSTVPSSSASPSPHTPSSLSSSTSPSSLPHAPTILHLLPGTPLHPDEPLIDFYERAPFPSRLPLSSSWQKLCASSRFLAGLTNQDINLATSWFSICWSPIHSTPSVGSLFSGRIYTFHGFELVGPSPLLPPRYFGQHSYIAQQHRHHIKATTSLTQTKPSTSSMSTSTSTSTATSTSKYPPLSMLKPALLDDHNNGSIPSFSHACAMCSYRGLSVSDRELLLRSAYPEAYESSPERYLHTSNEPSSLLNCDGGDTVPLFSYNNHTVTSDAPVSGSSCHGDVPNTYHSHHHHHSQQQQQQAQPHPHHPHHPHQDTAMLPHSQQPIIACIPLLGYMCVGVRASTWFNVSVCQSSLPYGTIEDLNGLLSHKSTQTMLKPKFINPNIAQSSSKASSSAAAIAMTVSPSSPNRITPYHQQPLQPRSSGAVPLTRSILTALPTHTHNQYCRILGRNNTSSDLLPVTRCFCFSFYVKQYTQLMQQIYHHCKAFYDQYYRSVQARSQSRQLLALQKQQQQQQQQQQQMLSSTSVASGGDTMATTSQPTSATEVPMVSMVSHSTSQTPSLSAHSLTQSTTPTTTTTTTSPPKDSWMLVFDDLIKCLELSSTSASSSFANYLHQIASGFNPLDYRHLLPPLHHTSQYLYEMDVYDHILKAYSESKFKKTTSTGIPPSSLSTTTSTSGIVTTGDAASKDYNGYDDISSLGGGAGGAGGAGGTGGGYTGSEHPLQQPNNSIDNNNHIDTRDGEDGDDGDGTGIYSDGSLSLRMYYGLYAASKVGCLYAPYDHVPSKIQRMYGCIIADTHDISGGSFGQSSQQSMYKHNTHQHQHQHQHQQYQSHLQPHQQQQQHQYHQQQKQMHGYMDVPVGDDSGRSLAMPMMNPPDEINDEEKLSSDKLFWFEFNPYLHTIIGSMNSIHFDVNNAMRNAWQ